MSKQRDNSVWIGLGFLVCVVFGLFSILCLINGIGEVYQDSQAYKVGFGLPRQSCAPDTVATFSTADGEVLDCTAYGAGPLGPVQADIPGFGQEQDDAVAGLARQLGTDGLDPDEQQQVQRLVDQYAASVIPELRPHNSDEMKVGPLRGANLAWTAAGGLLVAALVGLLLDRARR